MAATALLVGGTSCIAIAVAGQVGPPPAVPATSTAVPRVQVPASGATTPPQPVAATRSGKATVTRAAEPQPVRRVETAPPVRLTVPSVQIDTPLVSLALTPSGQIEAPGENDRAGWFQQGPRPGEVGAAVIAGHVDSQDGPAVFYHLSALEPGSTIDVERQDGSVATFSVDRIATYPKDDFRTVEVYATNDRELRLITCGGDFSQGSYEDNVVVFATLTDERAAD